MKKLFLVLLIGVCVLAGVVIYRTETMESARIEAEPFTQALFNEEELARELSRAVRFRTISRQDEVTNDEAFESFYRWMEKTYPNVAAKPYEQFTWSRLYHWQGTNPDLPPLLLMGHIDVVPVIPGTEKDWVKPPFAGEVSEGYVWGRGTMDMKGPTIMMLHALNAKMASGFKPERSVYISIHHDEEIGGPKGAQEIAKYMLENGIKPKLAFDEGGVISDGLMPGLNERFAMIGVSEKGYLTLQITAPGAGGHSSMPPRETAVGKLAKAIYRLESSPFPGKLDPPVSDMYKAIGPEMGYVPRMAAANLWLFSPMVESMMAASPSGDANLRTTTAPTMLEGSIKDNVLAIEAKAMVNFRLHPRDTSEAAIARVKQVIGDPDIKVERSAKGAWSEASPVSDLDGPVWRELSTTIAEVWPGILVGPSLTVGATDSRHYKHVSENVYRFAPFTVTPELRGGVHGTNERIALTDLVPMATFYWRLVDNTHTADAFNE